MTKLVLAMLLPTLWGCCATPSDTSSGPAIAADALHAAVSLQTIISLVALAVADDACRAKLPAEPYVGFNLDLDGSALGVYDRCMYMIASDPCEASAAELSTVKTLMAADGRLGNIATFSELLNALNTQCDSRGAVARAQRIATWPRRNLQRCAIHPANPVLIATAIYLRPPAFSDLDRQAGWASTCASVAGRNFLVDHCLGWPRTGRLARRGRLAKDIGVEPYFCAEIRKSYL